MDNRRIIFIGLAVILVLFLFNPFGRNRRKIPAPRASKETVAALQKYAQDYAVKPQQFIVKSFEKRDVVFMGGIGDSYIIKEHIDLLNDLIPILHKNGVHSLGIEQALSDDQSAIDEIVTASSYNEQRVKEILFRRHVMWGYQEYADLFRTAWKTNRYLEADQKPFRIVGLSPRHDWQYLQKEKDIKDKEIQRKILKQGLPSAHMAKIIRREILEKGSKALIFCNAPHVFTRYENLQYKENTAESGFEETRGAGNIVHAEIGDRTATILLHYPWPDDRSMYRVGRPFQGAICALISVLPAEKRTAGFETSNTPFGELEVRTGLYAYGYKDLSMQDLCDGYIIMGPIHEYNTVTPIPGFITEKNLKVALRDFPAPKNRLPSTKDPARAVQHMNGLVSGFAENTKRMLDLFKH
jgi:hypothetical protein